MEKENRKNDLSRYSDFDNLLYFRWKALIRREEYRGFYKKYSKEIKTFIRKKMKLYSNIAEKEKKW